VGGPALYPVYSIVESELLLRREVEDYATLLRVIASKDIPRHLLGDAELPSPLEGQSDSYCVNLTFLVLVVDNTNPTNFLHFTTPRTTSNYIIKNVTKGNKVLHNVTECLKPLLNVTGCEGR